MLSETQLNDVEALARRFEAVRPNFDHGGCYSLTLREDFDFERYLRVQRETFKRR